MRRAALLALVVAMGVAGGVAGAKLPIADLFHAPADQWHEIAWPFSRDAWPAGRAFRCDGGGCRGVEVYVRPKLGFCNCATGVSGDSEVDAVTDLDMLSEDFVPVRPGQPVTIAGMAGRQRDYTLRLAGGKTVPANGVAISRKCDVVVAASQGQSAGSPDAKRAIARLLETEGVLAWLNGLLGKG
jgi:hypothetical protein